MAVSRVRTYGLLNRWPEYMEVPLFHFNQAEGQGEDAPLSEPGQFVYVQAERERVVQGITKAVALASKRVEFLPRPEYVYESIPISYSNFGQLHKFLTKWRYVEAIGKRGLTVIQAGAPVAYDNPDDPAGLDTRATITVALPAGVTDAREVQVFFQAADSLGEAGSELWRVEPLDVQISGGVATITGHRALFVHPAFWRQPYSAPNYNSADKNVADVNDPADFVSSVDVYRVYADPTGAVTIRTGPAGCDAAGMTAIEGTAYVYDSALGLIGLDRVSCSACEWRWQYSVELYYRAGFPTDVLTGQMNAELEQAYIQLANAKMPMKMTSRDIGNEVWYRDARVYNSTELLEADRKNPFGLEYGSVDAWRVLRNFVRPATMRALR
jgi:hypothetical protein